MLPRKSCSLFELLRRRGLVSKGAADVGQHRGGRQRLRPHGCVGEHLLQRLALMIVRDRGAQGAPEPRNPMGVRIVRGRLDQEKQEKMVFALL